jgi:capsular polysaccharide biosynthesis protein
LQVLGEAAVTVLSTRSSAYFAQLGGQPASVTVLGVTPVTPAPPPLVDRFGVLLRVGLGLVAGVGLAFLAHYLDPVLRRREDVEALGIPVVGAIPRK